MKIAGDRISSRAQSNRCTAHPDSLDLYKRRSGVRDLILLVVSEDLCREGDEYLFGLARPETGNAVVSTLRLANDHYGRPPDDEELFDRLVKEAAHEVGHLLFLMHCRSRECLMANPLTLDDITRQKRGFWPRMPGSPREAFVRALSAPPFPIRTPWISLHPQNTATGSVSAEEQPTTKKTAGNHLFEGFEKFRTRNLESGKRNRIGWLKKNGGKSG